MNRIFLMSLTLALTASATLASGETTHRLYPGVNLYVHNPTGQAFDVTLTVRDLNLYSKGPREVLFKVTDPDGRTPVREVIPDDGVDGKGFLPRLGGWDHEMWYYALCYSRGTAPMFPWSTYSDPAFVAKQPARTFTRSIPAGQRGVYRILLMGSQDNYVTIGTSPAFKTAVSGNSDWLHGSGGMLAKNHILVPERGRFMHLAFIEMDPPQTRTFHLTAPDGKVLFDGTCAPGFREESIRLPEDGSYDGKVMTLEVSDGPGDFMMKTSFSFQYPTRTNGNGTPRMGHTQAVLAPDPATARVVDNGMIRHDGEIFFHAFQVRLHEWLKKLAPEAFIVHDADGKEVELQKGSFDHVLPVREGFVRLNGVHEPTPPSDRIMHSYTLHHNRAALNVALRDMLDGFMFITGGDHVSRQTFFNLAYEMGTYRFHWWRSGMRIVQDSDAPEEAKAIIREGLILGGDRLAFATGLERVNGNAFSHIPIALKYISEGTRDPMQLTLSNTFFERFATEGWGEGAGISRSGDSQEHFAHDNHYGSYVLSNLLAPATDFPDSPFVAMRNRLRTLYSYIWCPWGDANPWSSRTHHSFDRRNWSGEDMVWMGDPGADFTISVNDGDEWFAVRRPDYYAVTFHGRLAPAWLTNGFYGQVGFSGGILCQLSVPGKGLLFHSQLKDSYGKGMALENWRDFEIHSIVGTMAEGRPLVAAVSEHENARLNGHVVESSGDVRDRPVHVSRRYTFNKDHIAVEAKLSASGFTPLLTLWSRDRARQVGTLSEAWEMIPYGLGTTERRHREAKQPDVTLHAANGSLLGGLTADLTEHVGMIDVKRDGYGARIVLDTPAAVRKGGGDTILIRLADGDVAAEDVRVSYRIEPYRMDR